MNEMKLRVNDVSKWNDIALTYEYNGQYENAIKIYRQILTLFPNDFNTWENLGYILLKNREYQNAFRAYKKVLELEKDGIIYDELAYLYFLKGNYNKALESCNFAQRLDQDLKFSLKRLSCYYRKKGIQQRQRVI